MRKRTTAAALVLVGLLGCGDDEEIDTTGTWRGYVEAYSFRSGSDRVRVDIDEIDGEGNIVGRIVVGEGTPPPPATDPDVGYPDNVMSLAFYTPYEGFEHTLIESSYVDGRMRIRFNPNELWSGWCALQTPIPLDEKESVWGCLPLDGFRNFEDGTCGIEDGEGGYDPVDCGKGYLCTPGGPRPCVCDSERCEASDQSGTVLLDMAVEGDTADGTLDGIRDALRVRLQRE